MPSSWKFADSCDYFKVAGHHDFTTTKKLKTSTWNTSNHQNFLSNSQGPNTSVSHYQSVKKQCSITWLNMWWFQKYRKICVALWSNRKSLAAGCMRNLRGSSASKRVLQEQWKRAKKPSKQLSYSFLRVRFKVKQKFPDSQSFHHHIYIVTINEMAKIAIHKNFDVCVDHDY